MELMPMKMASLMAIVLAIGVDYSLQQACSTPGWLECNNGKYCYSPTLQCDYYDNCGDNTDETGCTYPAADMTKALVFLSVNVSLSPPLYVTTWFGDPSRYVPQLGVTTSRPSVTLSLPIFFDEVTLPVFNSITAIAIDYTNSKLIFSNGFRQRIEWASYIVNFDPVATYITGRVALSSQVVSVAFDWISRNVYWLDASYQQIGIVYIGSTTVYSKVVVSSISNPQDIAVDPLQGILFWISGPCGSAQIMRSGLDGSNSAPINSVSIASNNCPIKLAVDVSAYWLYWLDAYNSRVGYVSYAGRSSTLRYVSKADFGQMSSMTTFGGYLVLTSNTASTIQFYNKTSLDLVASSAPLTLYYTDVATYDRASQPIGISTSSCLTNNGGCDHLCFSTSLTTSVCGCTTGYYLSSNGTTCIYGTATTTTVATTGNTGTVAKPHNSGIAVTMAVAAFLYLII